MAKKSSFGGYDEERFVNEVNARLLCPICFKVVKDPVQCPNEHHYCRSCIQKCLHETTETCPTCQHHFTEETLAKPPRFLTETLERLEIRCDHASRGCREVVEVEFLDRHVERWGYSPTRQRYLPAEGRTRILSLKAQNRSTGLKMPGNQKQQ